MLVINDETLSDAVELTRSLVRIPSMNPPGNEDEIADFVQDVLQGVGIESTRVPLEKGRSSIVARIPGKNSGSIVLCGHLDTVRADEHEWSHPPFAAELEGDRMRGSSYNRGSPRSKTSFSLLPRMKNTPTAARRRSRNLV